MTSPGRAPFRSPFRYRLKRWLPGCAYLGCVAPLAYAALALWIVLDALVRSLRRRA